MSVNSIFAGSTPNSRDAIRQQYLNYLALEIANQTKNLNANKLFKANGTTGSAPADTRSATEKYADLDGLKQMVRSGLRQITDGREAETIVAELTTNEIEFLAGTLPAVIADLKPKFAMGVPAGSFIPYIRKYMRKAIETEGVEYGIQQPQIGGVGGGFVTTAANLVPRNQLDDLAGNLELASLKTNIGDRAKAKLDELRGLGKTKYQGTDGGFRGREQTVEMLMKKMPNEEDRRAIADEGSLDTLYEYDQHVNELGENMPSSNEIKALTDEIQDAIESDRYEDLDDYLFDLEGLLDGIDWELLDVVYDTAQTARQILRGEISSPQLKQAQQQRGIKPNLRDLERVQDFESIEPFAGEELLARPRQAFGREIVPEQEEASMPTAYATPQMPEQRPIGDPFDDRSNRRDILSADEFQELTQSEKLSLIAAYDGQRRFENLPELAPELQKLAFGGAVSEDELDYLYGHYLVLTGNDTGNLDTMEPQGEAPQPMGRPQFEDESGLGWAMEEENPLTDPNAAGNSRFNSLPRDRKLEILREIADAEGGRTRRGDFVKNQLLFVKPSTPDSKLNSIIDTFESIDVNIPSEASSAVKYLESLPPLPESEGEEEVVAEKALPIPKTLEEFADRSPQEKRNILQQLQSEMSAPLRKRVEALKAGTQPKTLNSIFEDYIQYITPALLSSAVKAGTTPRAKSGSEEEEGEEATTAEAQSSMVQPEGKKIIFPNSVSAFNKFGTILDKLKIIEKAMALDLLDEIVDHEDDIDKPNYGELIIPDKQGISLRKQIDDAQARRDYKETPKAVLEEWYRQFLPVIKYKRETNKMYGMGLRPSLKGCGGGYGLPHTLKPQQTMGGSLKKTHMMPDGSVMTGAKHTSKSKPTMMSNDVIHIDFEKGSLPKSKKKGNIIFGMGLSSVSAFPKSDAKVRLDPKNIDFTKGIPAEPTYVPFGTHLLNKHKLKDNIVMLRTKKGGAIQNIETQKVSGKLSKVLHTICGGSVPQFESVMDLADNDKALLHRITKTTKVSDRLSVPNPNKSKMEEEDNRFNILRGEVSIGNDNPAVVKEFKVLLLKFMNERRVPIGQGRAILEEMLMLGY